jgi:hypothetical protein
MQILFGYMYWRNLDEDGYFFLLAGSKHWEHSFPRNTNEKCLQVDGLVASKSIKLVGGVC